MKHRARAIETQNGTKRKKKKKGILQQMVLSPQSPDLNIIKSVLDNTNTQKKILWKKHLACQVSLKKRLHTFNIGLLTKCWWKAFFPDLVIYESTLTLVSKIFFRPTVFGELWSQTGDRRLLAGIASFSLLTAKNIFIDFAAQMAVSAPHMQPVCFQGKSNYISQGTVHPSHYRK